MHPYREPPRRAHRCSTGVPADQAQAPAEELIIYGLLLVIGAIPVAVALLGRATLGVEATLGLLMISAGVSGAVACALRTLRDHTS
jgi:hypothetical protein